MRLDCYLVQSTLAPTRQKGRYLIDNSLVLVDGKVCTKPSTDVEGRKVELLGQGMPYVSRGGFKLEGAIKAFSLDIKDKVCADIGASTGGFTDCLLQNGAKRVYAVDCGSDQLHEKLRSDLRVRSIENFNARDLCESTLGEKVDIAVCDLSFISQTLIHKNAYSILKDGGIFVSLIKPQFEAGRNGISKGGIVRSESVRKKAVDTVVSSALSQGFTLVGVELSPIKGSDGNIEFISAFKK